MYLASQQPGKKFSTFFVDDLSFHWLHPQQFLPLRGLLSVGLLPVAAAALL
jgi:hypothetical protein